MQKRINDLTQSEYRRAKRLIAQGRLKSELDGEKYEVIDYAEFKGIKALKSGRPRKVVQNAND